MRFRRAWRLISATLAKGAVGAYQLQAAVAAVHDEAASEKDTDWAQILALYGLLMRMSDNPMVVLNHAIAAAMVHGPHAGLELLLALDADPRMADHHRLDAVRGHLQEMAGDREAAIEYYRAAAMRTTSHPGAELSQRESSRARGRAFSVKGAGSLQERFQPRALDLVGGALAPTDVCRG